MTDQAPWNAQAGWRQLESSAEVPTRGEFRVLDASVATSDGRVLLAVDGAGLRHVLVPVADDFEAGQDRRSGGVHLITRPLVDEVGQRRFLDLACQKAHLNNVFAHLADEVLLSLREDPRHPFQVCRRTLQRWRELLDRESAAVMSTESLCGLFGELWHLAAIAAVSPEGISSWQGPHGARHDFARSGWALEVKTTLRRDEWKFRVHGVTQLDTPTGATLYLCAMRLELNGASGVTVPEIIHQILEGGVDRRELVGRLMLAGFDLRDEEHYRQFRFAVLDLQVYEVSTQFPRLTAFSFGTVGIPQGIQDIHYTIDLAAARPPALPEGGLSRVHAALAGAQDVSAPGPPV